MSAPDDHAELVAYLADWFQKWVGEDWMDLPFPWIEFPASAENFGEIAEAIVGAGWRRTPTADKWEYGTFVADRLGVEQKMSVTTFERQPWSTHRRVPAGPWLPVSPTPESEPTSTEAPEDTQ